MLKIGEVRIQPKQSKRLSPNFWPAVTGNPLEVDYGIPLAKLVEECGYTFRIDGNSAILKIAEEKETKTGCATIPIFVATFSWDGDLDYEERLKVENKAALAELSRRNLRPLSFREYLTFLPTTNPGFMTHEYLTLEPVVNSEGKTFYPCSFYFLAGPHGVELVAWEPEDTQIYRTRHTPVWLVCTYTDATRAELWSKAHLWLSMQYPDIEADVVRDLLSYDGYVKRDARVERDREKEMMRDVHSTPPRIKRIESAREFGKRVLERRSADWPADEKWPADERVGKFIETQIERLQAGLDCSLRDVLRGFSFRFKPVRREWPHPGD